MLELGPKIDRLIVEGGGYASSAFANVGAGDVSDGDTIRLSPAFFQPISSDDVAAAAADFAVGEPRNGIVEIAGPERVRLSDLMRRFLLATNDSHKVVEDPSARYFGADDSRRHVAAGRAERCPKNPWTSPVRPGPSALMTTRPVKRSPTTGRSLRRKSGA